MIGERIKAEREARGWSQSELARRSKITQAFISQIESGDRREIGMKTAQKLAAAFGLSLDALAADTPLASLLYPDMLAIAAGETEQDRAEVREAWPHLSRAQQLQLIGMLEDLAFRRRRLTEKRQQFRPPDSPLAPPEPAGTPPEGDGGQGGSDLHLAPVCGPVGS